MYQTKSHISDRRDQNSNSFEQTHPKIIKQVNDLMKAGPYRIWGTLTFQYGLTEPKAKHEFSKFWRKVQREVLHRNWIEKKRPEMTGIAVLERAPIFLSGEQSAGSCHFHFLLHANAQFEEDDRQAELQLGEAFERAAASLTHKNKRWQLTSLHGTGVGTIWDMEGICGYVLKEAANWWWKPENHLLYLCRDGAI